MADTTRNIFSLSEYSDDTIAGDGIPVDSVFLTDGAPASAAYVTKGGPAGHPSQLKKADMSTDTFTSIPATFPGPAGSNRSSLGMGSTKDAVWYVAGWAYPGGGGGANGARNDYNKTPFATDTMTQVPGNLPSGRYDIGGTANGANGAIYFYAGRTYNNGYQSDNVKLMTPTGTAYTLDGGFPESGGVGSVGGNGEKAYIMGMKESAPGNTSKSMRFSYITESANYLPGGNLEHPGKANTTNIGTVDSQYMAGFMGPGSVKRSYTQKLDFTTEGTALVPSAPLTETSSKNGGIGNYTTHGYILGADSPTGEKSYIQKLLYSTDTISTIPAVLISNNAGEGRSGAENGVPATVPKVRFQDGAESTPNYSWFAGGTSGLVTTVNRLDMTTDTTDNMSSMYISGSRQLSTNQGSSPTTGYYAGSWPGGTSQVRKLNYSAQTESYQPGMNIPGTPADGLEKTAIAGNSTSGYIMGGHYYPNSTKSWVNKINYASDGVNRIPSANIASVPNEYGTGEGTTAISSSGDTSGAAYLFAGQQWPSQGIRSNIWKMTYSTETTAALPSFGESDMFMFTGHSEKSAGYIGGGSPTSYPEAGKMYKFPWATETLTADGGTDLSRNAGSGGNQQYAYQVGGAPSSNNSTSSYIRKFTYATSNTEVIPARYTAGPKTNIGGMGALTNNLPSVPAAPTATPTPSVSKETHTYGIYRTSYRSYSQKKDFTTGTTSTIPTSGNVQVAADLVSDENAIYTNDWNTTGRSTKIPWATQSGTSSPNTWTTSVNPYWTGAKTATNMTPTKGYFTGGIANAISPSPNDGVGRRRQHIVFATGTGVSEGDKAEDYIYFAASSDSATRGYMYGGYNYNQGGTGKITYMNFATDGSFNAVPGTPGWTLSYNRAEAVAVGNREKAYIAGTRYNIPNIPAQVSRMEKFTYATETNQNLPGLNTPYASNRDMSATGDQEKGYWAGSFDNPNAFVITYATETKSGTPNYPVPNSNSSPRAISQAQNAQPGKINVPVSFQ